MKFSEAFELWQKEGGYLVLWDKIAYFSYEVSGRIVYKKYMTQDIRGWHHEEIIHESYPEFTMRVLLSDQWQVKPNLESQQEGSGK